VRRWQRYWFAEGGRVSCAILRIAIAFALMLTLERLRNTWPSGAAGSPGPHPAYRPVGVWMLMGHHEPPVWLIDVLWAAAWTGAIGMLVGAYARVSAAVAFVAGVGLAALSYSATKTWSHQYNVVFIALFAFQGARSSDALSWDAYWRRARGMAAIDVPRGYQWSIRLVQVAVAVMYASGMFHKVLHGHMTLAWAFSDNLRNHLLVRYDLASVPRPAIVDWMIDDPTRYHLAALGNLFTQTVPLAAIFLVRRPVLRALAGSFFVLETVALGVVMQLWNLHWLPLAAVFIDWEALLRIRQVPATPEGYKPPRGPSIFIIAFIVYDVVLAFAPGLDQWVNTYPISAFPMFATIRAREPYSAHQPYSVSGVHFEIEPSVGGASQWLDYQYRTVVQISDAGALEKKLAAILADARGRYPDTKLVRAWLTIYEAPAVPAPAHFEPHPIAILGEYDGTVFRTRWTKTLPAQVPDAVYYRDDIPEPHPMTEWKVPAGNPVYVVQPPWLLYQSRQRQ
jgi:hypothetical protein